MKFHASPTAPNLLPTPGTRVLALAGLVMLLPLVGCGSEDAPQQATSHAQAPGLQHLELRLLNEAKAGPHEEFGITSKLYPPKGLAPWSGKGKRVFENLVPAGPSEAELPGYTTASGSPQMPGAIVLEDAGQARDLRVPGPFAAKSFNRVVLRIAVPQEEELRIAFYTDGEQRVQSEVVSVAGNPLPQLVVFDLPILRSVQGALDELRVEGAGHTQGMMLLEVALAKSPLTSFIEQADAGPMLIELGHAHSSDDGRFDKRRGVGLYSGAPAEVIFSAPQDHSLLFSYAVPAALRIPGSDVQLKVSVESGGGERVELALPLDTVVEGWRTAELALTGLGAGEKRALFELSGAGSQQAGSAIQEVCAIAELRVVGKQPTPRTVLLITSDTHRGDHIGALGASAPVRTPAIDALAARGVLFSDAYAASNTTNPSHTSLMTGVHVRDSRVLDNRSPLTAEAHTLAEAFRERGFHTLAAVSVRHLMDDESGLGQGFDRMSGPLGSERGARDTTSQVTEWLDGLAGEPIFLWFHIFDAHSPYEPPAATDRRYYDKRKDPFDPSQRLQFNGRFLPVYLRGLTDIDFPYAQYRAEIDALDMELARVLEHPRIQSAIVGFTADHGESFGNHGIWWDHAGLHPDTLHIPLLLAWPDAPRGAHCDVPVRQMDLGRTLLNLAGEEAAEFTGGDLREALGEGAGAQTRYGIAKEGNAASILKEGWLLVINLRDSHPTAVTTERKRHTLELYDLNSDPQAERECASTQTERTAELRAALIDWLSRASAHGLASEGLTTAAQRSRLASLGYTGDGADETARAGQWIDPACTCGECSKFLK